MIPRKALPALLAQACGADARVLRAYREAVRILAEQRVLSSPEFWEEHATSGKTLPGDYVATVINKSVSKSKR